MNVMKNNLIKLKLKKNKSDIFYDNNLLFETMPMRGLKTEKKNSTIMPK